MLRYGGLSTQGHSRRLQVCVKPVQNSGTLPLLVEAVLSVSIGCVSARCTKLQRPLDSYQVCETQILMFAILTCNLDCEIIMSKKSRMMYLCNWFCILGKVCSFHASHIQHYADLAKVSISGFVDMTGSSGSLAVSLKKTKECKNSLVPYLFGLHALLCPDVERKR